MKNFIYLALACFSLSACSEQNKNEVAKPFSDKSRPNIVIFYADDQGTLDAGIYGSKDIETPNLDALAAQGTRFTQAYGHTVCCPSRAALLTGRAPQRSGVNTWTSCNPNDREGRVMNLKEVTLAEHLKSEGYKTALIGKWHLGATPDHGPLDQGFDYFFGFRGGFIDYYSHRFLHAGWQRPQFHDLYRNKEEIFADGQYFPDMQLTEVENFLEKNKNDPFFLYVPFNLPHYPEQPDSTYVDRYMDLPWPRSSYAPMISTIDDRMGKMLQKIDELGIRENTLVIYMSDNGHSTEDYYNWGESYGANGGGGNTGKWRGAKGSFFEGGLRVPAIFSMPGTLPQNEVRDQAMVNLDIVPTICELLNIPQPNQVMDGESVLSILKNDSLSTPDRTMHWMWQHMWAVRDGDWKLIYKGHDTTGEYSSHLQSDFKMPDFYLAKLSDEKPEEVNYAEQYPEIVERLTALHQTWAVDVFASSDFPNPNMSQAANAKKLGTTKL